MYIEVDKNLGEIKSDQAEFAFMRKDMSLNTVGCILTGVPLRAYI
jgi:hypothetical protein